MFLRIDLGVQLLQAWLPPVGNLWTLLPSTICFGRLWWRPGSGIHSPCQRADGLLPKVSHKVLRTSCSVLVTAHIGPTRISSQCAIFCVVSICQRHSTGHIDPVCHLLGAHTSAPQHCRKFFETRSHSVDNRRSTRSHLSLLRLGVLVVWGTAEWRGSRPLRLWEQLCSRQMLCQAHASEWTAHSPARGSHQSTSCLWNCLFIETQSYVLCSLTYFTEQKFSRFIHVIFYPLWLNNAIEQYISSFQSILLLDIWVSAVWLLWITLLQTFVYRFLCSPELLFSWAYA